MYLVYNRTKNVVNLSDLGIEIPPEAEADISMMARMEDILRSRDLKEALHRRILAQGRKMVIKQATPKEPKPAKESLTEDRIREIVVDAIRNNQDASYIAELLNGLSQKIDTLKTAPVATAVTVQPVEEKVISDEQLADLHQKSIDNIAEQVENNDNKQKKVIVLKNTNLKNIVDQL